MEQNKRDWWIEFSTFNEALVCFRNAENQIVKVPIDEIRKETEKIIESSKIIIRCP